VPTDDTVDRNVHRLGSHVTLVGETYIVALRGEYVTALNRPDGRLAIGVHMTQAEACELLAGLQEALR